MKKGLLHKGEGPGYGPRGGTGGGHVEGDGSSVHRKNLIKYLIIGFHHHQE